MNVYKRMKAGLSAVIMLSLLFALSSCNQSTDEQKEEVKEHTKLTYGSVSVIIEAPTHIAFYNKYFAEEGIDLQLNMNPDGKTSLQQLFTGKADIIGVAGTPIVYSSFKRDDFYIIGDIKHSNIHFCLARKDKGIHTASDLRGKKVAVMTGTSAEFFMDLFLAYQGILRSELDIVDMNAPTMLKSIAAGEIDAMFCWEPWLLQAKKELGENANILPNEHIHVGSWLIIAMKEYVDQHPEIIERFVKALVRAEEFIKKNKEKSVERHATVSGVNKDIASALLGKLTYGIALDEALLDILEDQARWAIRSGYTDKSEVPDYLNLIYFPALESIKPDAVTIIK